VSESLPEGVRPERNGWRDEEISNRHRMWGWDCPAADLDFVMVEYNFGKPAALIEYKHHKCGPVDIGHKSFQAMQHLADAADIPFLIAWYWPGKWAFKAMPVNRVAKQFFTSPYERMSERDFVRRLYRLRNQVLGKELGGRLNTETPND